MKPKKELKYGIMGTYPNGDVLLCMGTSEIRTSRVKAEALLRKSRALGSGSPGYVPGMATAASGTWRRSVI